ncbi:hypothetical protein [Paraflavitalea speifideaquila]|uniref:hypothetical protein n=1 Tax=Paraflavitalea speifideaquila TaxID=3076558 RepID=UPI0028E66E39|nr:hypothetical protein [Paraflavitalea speifideiaquila]
MSRNRSAKPLPEIFISKEVVNERVQNFVDGKYALLSADMGDPKPGLPGIR